VKKEDLRRHQRYLVPEGQPLRCEGIGIRCDGAISVFGLGGMFIRTRDSHPVGATLALRIHGVGDDIRAECVVRDVHPNGFGAEFTNLAPAEERKLKNLALSLKP
jgi:PilZ domain